MRKIGELLKLLAWCGDESTAEAEAIENLKKWREQNAKLQKLVMAETLLLKYLQGKVREPQSRAKSLMQRWAIIETSSAEPRMAEFQIGRNHLYLVPQAFVGTLMHPKRITGQVQADNLSPAELETLSVLYGGDAFSNLKEALEGARALEAWH